MTLYKELRNEMENHKEFWNYYNVNFGDAFQNQTAARDFIYKYFAGGSKLHSLDIWTKSIDQYIEMRNVHTVNVFFIGIFLQRRIDENISIKSEVSSDYPFSYLWYLLCLAHDLGYTYEKYSTTYIKRPLKLYYAHHNYNQCNRLKIYSSKFYTRRKWDEDHGIDIGYLNSSLWGRRIISHYMYRNQIYRLSKDIEYNNGILIKRPRYSLGTINNYFYYRLYEMNTLDHGIVGADDFYSRLVGNYLKEYRRMDSRYFAEGNICSFYNQEELYFCSEQIKIFAYIADCIASHNMYKADDNERCRATYVEYSLNSLLPEMFQPISYKENPLLFILCVADTIEPSKKFIEYSNKDVLKLISIEYNAFNNFLHVEVDEKLYASTAGKEYVSSIKALEQWCDIKIMVEVKKFGENDTDSK